VDSTLLRHPAVAGRFYPGEPDDLRAEALTYLSIEKNPVRAIGCIARAHRSPGALRRSLPKPYG